MTHHLFVTYHTYKLRWGYPIAKRPVWRLLVMHVFHERHEGGVRRNHQSTAQRQPRYVKQDLDTLLRFLLQPDQPLILHVRNSAVPSHKLLSALRSKITITLFIALFNISTHNCIAKVNICPLEFKTWHSFFSLNSPIHTYNVIRILKPSYLPLTLLQLLYQSTNCVAPIMCKELVHNFKIYWFKTFLRQVINTLSNGAQFNVFSLNTCILVSKIVLEKYSFLCE